MIAVGRTSHCDAAGDSAVFAGEEIARRYRACSALPLDFAGEQAQHGVGTAQRLEAAEAKARAFILVVNRPDSDAGGESRQAIPGNLEEIGEASALLLTDAPMRRGSKVWITCELHNLKGRVKSCSQDRELGYFIEVALDADSGWSPTWFTPKHLLRVFRTLAA